MVTITCRLGRICKGKRERGGAGHEYAFPAQVAHRRLERAQRGPPPRQQLMNTGAALTKSETVTFSLSQKLQFRDANSMRKNLKYGEFYAESDCINDIQIAREFCQKKTSTVGEAITRSLFVSVAPVMALQIKHH